MVSAEERYIELRKLITNITHLPEKGFETRQVPYPTLNSIIWVQMRNEGYTLKQIARACNRTHSTVIKMSNRTIDIIKTRNKAWNYELTVWDILQERLKELSLNIPRSSKLEIIVDKLQRLSEEELDEIRYLLKEKKDAEKK